MSAICPACQLPWTRLEASGVCFQCDLEGDLAKDAGKCPRCGHPTRKKLEPGKVCWDCYRLQKYRTVGKKR